MKFTGMRCDLLQEAPEARRRHSTADRRSRRHSMFAAMGVNMETARLFRQDLEEHGQ